MAWQIWLVVAGLCFVIEMATVGFLVFWFGIGALITMIISLIFPDNIILQVSIFVISSTILLFLTKPIVNKLTKKDKKVATNAYSIIGKKAVVTKKIDSKLGVGQIKVAGEKWSAKPLDEKEIEEDEEVEVVKIDGVKAVVKTAKSSSNIFSK